MSASKPNNRRNDRANTTWQANTDDWDTEGYIFGGGNAFGRYTSTGNNTLDTAIRNGEANSKAGTVNGASKAPKVVPTSAESLDALWAQIDALRQTYQALSLSYHPMRIAYNAAKQAYTEALKTYTLMTEGN